MGQWRGERADSQSVSTSHGHSLKHRAEDRGKPIKHNRLGGLLMTPHLLVQPGMLRERKRDCVKREREGLWDTV